jgi:hypothetical protein
MRKLVDHVGPEHGAAGGLPAGNDSGNSCTSTGSPSSAHPHVGRSPTTPTATPSWTAAEEVTTRFPDRCFAFDVVRAAVHPPAPRIVPGPARGRPDRLRATYHRDHGVRYFHGRLQQGARTGWWGVAVATARAHHHSLAALRSIRAALPGRRPDLRDPGQPVGEQDTADPGNGRGATLVELNPDPDQRVRGPTRSKPSSGQLRMFTMSNSDHPNHTVLARKVQAYLRWRNAQRPTPRRAGRTTPRTGPSPQRTPAFAGDVPEPESHDQPGEPKWPPH